MLATFERGGDHQVGPGRLTRRVEQALERLFLARDEPELRDEPEAMIFVARAVSSSGRAGPGLDDRVREVSDQEWERMSDGSDARPRGAN